jgi:hypothetical protein
MGHFFSAISLTSLLSRAYEDREFMAEPPVLFSRELSAWMRHFCETCVQVDLFSRRVLKRTLEYSGYEAVTAAVPSWTG